MTKWSSPPVFKPRVPEIEGIDHPKVVGYIDVITGRKPVGKTVAVIGAGGIGFDVSRADYAQGCIRSAGQAGIRP